jgi:twinfilin-like protein
MMYASSSRSAVTIAENEAGLSIAKRIEASDPGDITEESVLGDLHPKVETKKAFERPRRPGRK